MTQLLFQWHSDYQASLITQEPGSWLELTRGQGVKDKQTYRRHWWLSLGLRNITGGSLFCTEGILFFNHLSRSLFTSGSLNPSLNKPSLIMQLYFHFYLYIYLRLNLSPSWEHKFSGIGHLLSYIFHGTEYFKKEFTFERNQHLCINTNSGFKMLEARVHDCSALRFLSSVRTVMPCIMCHVCMI